MGFNSAFKGLNPDKRMLAATTDCVSPLNARYMFR